MASRTLHCALVLSLPLLLASCASTRAPAPSASTLALPTQAAPALPTVLPQPVPATLVTESAEVTALRELVLLQDRLYRVAAPLLVKNTDLCGSNARNLLGFIAKNKYSFSAEMSQAAQALYGFDERLRVTGVLAESGASRAGMRVGDIIDSVEGRSMPQGPNAERQAASVLGPVVSAAGPRGVKLALLRGSAQVAVTVPLTRACAYSVELGNSDNVNAYNDGRRILLTRGMLNFARSDEELAYVLAREMSHNALQHTSKQGMTGTVSDIIDNLVRIRPDLTSMSGSAGVRPSSREFDAAADVMALYMLARANYDYVNAQRFWERMAAEVPVGVQNGYTNLHPATAYRIEAMEKALPEVKRKQRSKMPLLP